jgi:hypothetical protein
MPTTDTPRLAATHAALEAHEIDVDLCAGELAEDQPKLDRYLLVEKNQLGDPPYYVTTHRSPEAAGAYHWGQEYYADFDIRLVVDLDTDDRYVIEQRFIARKIEQAAEA